MLKILLVLIVLGLAAMVYRVIVGENLGYIVSHRFAPTFCRFMGHRRRGDAVRKVDGVYHSKCRRCGVRLTKAGRDAEWEVERVSSPPAQSDETIVETTAESAMIGPISLAALLIAGAVSLGILLAPQQVTMRSTPGRGPLALADPAGHR